LLDETEDLISDSVRVGRTGVLEGAGQGSHVGRGLILTVFVEDGSEIDSEGDDPK
jgi:hypothetical protein